MLTMATLAMAVYGGYSLVFGLVDLFFRSRLEVLADLGLVGFGVLLLLAAPLVRVLIPGGLALAIGALLGLQALSIHNDLHVAGSLALPSQIARGILAVAIVGLALAGARQARQNTERG